MYLIIGIVVALIVIGVVVMEIVGKVIEKKKDVSVLRE